MHAARGEEETVARDESGGQCDSSAEMETDSKSDTGSENNTTNKAIETMDEQATIDVARDIVKNAKRMGFIPENLRMKHRNKTFNRVVQDWRCRNSPRLMCLSDDVIEIGDLHTGDTHLELKDLEHMRKGYLDFWE